MKPLGLSSVFFTHDWISEALGSCWKTISERSDPPVPVWTVLYEACSAVFLAAATRTVGASVRCFAFAAVAAVVLSTGLAPLLLWDCPPPQPARATVSAAPAAAAAMPLFLTRTA
ncbi:hypothetical protein [Kitasatospora sp. NPDC089509]|uniref:hypothetical protein n=1 Tax=Kitasatospora sp. NPDC089509 TaxID=3364079 RepID=UPI00381FD7E8